MYLFMCSLVEDGLDKVECIMLHVQQANALTYSLSSSLIVLKVWINIKKPVLKLEHLDIVQFVYLFVFFKSNYYHDWPSKDRILTWDPLEVNGKTPLISLTHCERSTITIRKTILTLFVHKNHNWLKLVNMYYSSRICLHTYIYYRILI